MRSTHLLREDPTAIWYILCPCQKPLVRRQPTAIFTVKRGCDEFWDGCVGSEDHTEDIYSLTFPGTTFERNILWKQTTYGVFRITNPWTVKQDCSGQAEDDSQGGRGQLWKEDRGAAAAEEGQWSLKTISDYRELISQPEWGLKWQTTWIFSSLDLIIYLPLPPASSLTLTLLSFPTPTPFSPPATACTCCTSTAPLGQRPIPTAP